MSHTFRPVPLSEAELTLADAALKHFDHLIGTGALECAGYVLVGGRIYREDGEAEPLPLAEFLQELAAVLEPRQAWRREVVRPDEPDPRDSDPAGPGCEMPRAAPAAAGPSWASRIANAERLTVWFWDTHRGEWRSRVPGGIEASEAWEVSAALEEAHVPTVMLVPFDAPPEKLPDFWDFQMGRRRYGTAGDGTSHS